MFRKRKHVVVLTVALLTLGTLTAALLWGTGFSAVLAAPAAALEASKSVSSQEIAPGQSLQYTLVLTNTSGTSLSNVRAGDALDPSLSYVLGSDHYDPPGTPGYDGVVVNNTITFTIATMAPDSVVTITFDADLSPSAVPDTTIDNVAEIYSDTVYVLDTNTASFDVSPTPDLQIYSPESGVVITQQPSQTLEISGRVWAQFDPAPFPDAPVLQPISNFGGIGSFTVSWDAAADAANYVLQESSTEGFDSPTDYGVPAPATSKFVAGKSVGTYYYRVAAYNALSRPSRWSNVEVVTVTSGSLAALWVGADDILSVDAVDLTVADALVAVQVSTNNGATWHDATLTENPSGWWDWTYDWELPEGDGVQQPIAARANYTAGGDYGTDTITVTLDNSTFLVYVPIIFKYWPPIPYAPTLNDIEVIGDGEDLRVSWTYSDGSASIPDPTEYQLQEATDVNFTQNVADYTIFDSDNNASKDLLDKRGTFYYRVRGKNTYGYGLWSVVKSISTANTSYYFDDGTEGWEITRSDEATNSDQLRDPVERDGNLYHMVFGSWDYSILSPMEEAPSVPYTIEAEVDIIDSESVGDGDYTAKSGQGYGIIFGGNGGSPCPADRYDAGGCLDHYYRLLVVYDQGNGSLKWALKRIEGHEDDGTARGTSLVGWRTVSGVSYAATGWNTWRIEVEADNDIKIYFKGVHQATANDDDYINDPYFGVLLESTEFGEVGAKWDYFTVEPSN
ncbi:MAG: hypothetical protein MUQ30_11465 [Anaerolineae bacterium]|nr:hypothetical protein [Anaerolineae bacterium]